MKISTLLGAALLISTAMIIDSTAYAGERETGRGTGPVVYVSSQGLFYDSIVVADPIPALGNFQQLTMGENGLTTEYGPGQPGHLGGRWWLDLTDDGVMNEGDKFFLCPLLGPGRTTM
jgi:hypothetical protein